MRRRRTYVTLEHRRLWCLQQARCESTQAHLYRLQPETVDALNHPLIRDLIH